MVPLSFLPAIIIVYFNINRCYGSITATPESYCPISSRQHNNCPPFPYSFLPHATEALDPLRADAQILEDAFSALAVLQNEYYDSWRNTWPLAIDWTAAVVETVVSGTLTTLTRSLDVVIPGGSIGGWKSKENLMSSFYDEVISYYFGQDIDAIKTEAFDDMLWVVLGWIEATNFIRIHESLHYPESQDGLQTYPVDMKIALESLPWRGKFWAPSFESRACTFWNLAARGWDTKLCHGGMVWNPRLEPYKNAITNELYISASIAMYQYVGLNDLAEKEPVFLQAAIEGYKWLYDSNMTNSQGLFADGFHISRRKHGNVECDLRDEMVYTYNQGVILTGQRELWEVTGSPSYLDDGHELIQSVIRATGWDLITNGPLDRISEPGKLPKWRGLGRGGILEEQCDASGTCSQDGQTFKGIYFHHLTAFCKPLKMNNIDDDDEAIDLLRFQRAGEAHEIACKAYLGWIRHNVLAALGTRDSKGRFGMWWGPGLFGNIYVSPKRDGINHQAANSTDYRNHGTPDEDLWGRNERWLPGSRTADALDEYKAPPNQQQLGRILRTEIPSGNPRGDPNNRGRGRTVETQAGGLALLRAYWEISQAFS